MTKQALRTSLVRDLHPVARRGAGLSFALWMLAAWLFVAVWILSTGEFRPDLANDWRAPRFAIELVVATLSVAAALFMALRLSIPGRTDARAALFGGLTLLVVWGLLLLYGMANPALEPSMEGKRAHCVYETFTLAILPLCLALFLAARLAPTARVTTGLLLGAASGALPALWMQVACMYIPWHGLTHHLFPIAAVTALGALAGWKLLPRL